MYTDYFGLQESPFSIAPDPQYLFLSQRDREALAHFQYGMRVSGGFVQLTGEVGTGKTMLIRSLLEQLPDDVDVALMLNPAMTVNEFLAAICDELRISYEQPGDSLKQLVDTLNRYLLDNHARGRRTVLIMDEAQHLSLGLLEQVRLLTNLETTKYKLLQIILVGQPELREKLAARNMRQLAQRITARYELVGLKRQETYDYIAHRCQVAGADRPLFTPTAMAQIFRLSQGNPRMINILCDRALVGAYAGSLAVVDAKTVKLAAKEIGESIPGRRYWRLLWPAAAAMGVLLLTASLWLLLSAPWGSNTAVATAMPSPTTQLVVADVVRGKALAQLLEAPTGSDTSSAFRGLFQRWSVANIDLTGRAACDVAQEQGLRCFFSTGTWNNLRSYNRPSVIELIDAQGGRHHVLVERLGATQVALNFAGDTYEFTQAEVDRFWFGKYLLLWRPPATVPETLRRGNRGNAVLWLRQALARSQGENPESVIAMPAYDVFDWGLEAQLKAFQRRHQLVADGVVGQLTLMQLNQYGDDVSTPRLWDGTAAQSG